MNQLSKKVVSEVSKTFTFAFVMKIDQKITLNSYSDCPLTKLLILGLVLIDQSERIFPDVRRIGEIRQIGEIRPLGEGFQRKKFHLHVYAGPCCTRSIGFVSCALRSEK